MYSPPIAVQELGLAVGFRRWLMYVRMWRDVVVVMNREEVISSESQSLSEFGEVGLGAVSTWFSSDGAITLIEGSYDVRRTFRTTLKKDKINQESEASIKDLSINQSTVTNPNLSPQQ